MFTSLCHNNVRNSVLNCAFNQGKKSQLAFPLMQTQHRILTHTAEVKHGREIQLESCLHQNQFICSVLCTAQTHSWFSRGRIAGIDVCLYFRITNWQKCTCLAYYYLWKPLFAPHRGIKCSLNVKYSGILLHFTNFWHMG